MTGGKRARPSRIGILGTCIKEAPEFADARRARKCDAGGRSRRNRR